MLSGLLGRGWRSAEFAGVERAPLPSWTRATPKHFEGIMEAPDLVTPSGVLTVCPAISGNEPDVNARPEIAKLCPKRKPCQPITRWPIDITLLRDAGRESGHCFSLPVTFVNGLGCP